MINTLQIKQQQLSKGFFTTGSGSDVVLLIGSCRICNYVSYLNEWNKLNGNRFTIHTLDPFNWCFDLEDNRTDFESVILSLEKDERILTMLKSVDIILHEYYSNFGMFNFDKSKEKNIYQFGLNPKIDVCICNFNDYFLLSADIVNFDVEAKKMAIADYNVLGKLSTSTVEYIRNIAAENLGKFLTVCHKSDIPEMSEYFLKNHFDKRMQWSFNHITELFTRTVFNFINDKFLHLDLTNFPTEFEDIFRHGINTPLTDFDVDHLGYNWDEEIVPLRSKL